MNALELTEGQRLAADQLADVSMRSAGAVEVVAGPAVLERSDAVRFRISLDCTQTPTAPAGLALRAREQFLVDVPPDFPFALPTVSVPHTRWAGTPHVQWARVLCLYAAPSVDWLPADGMRGLVDRLLAWLADAAEDFLDPVDLPLHPPVAYTRAGADGLVVVRTDLPAGKAAPGLRSLIAVCAQQYAERVDVVEWVDPRQWRSRFQTAEVTGEFGREGARTVGAVTLLLERDIGFEYPDGGGALLDGLAAAGVAIPELLALLRETAATNARLDNSPTNRAVDAAARPLHLFIGTPSRRADAAQRPRAHLVCWRFAPADQAMLADRAVSDANAESSLRATDVTWVPVHEQRPEVARRRDEHSDAAWLSGKRVLILGCGALGAPVAEMCVRAGSARVDLADRGRVTPGILVRQPYADAEVGLLKSHVLATRLNAVHGDDRVAALLPGDIVTVVLNAGFDPGMYDLIIDAAADTAVTARLERARVAHPGAWPPILTMIIGYDACRGLVALAKPGASGAGRDALRKLHVAAAAAPHRESWADVREDFFPTTRRTPQFQPEPGCSQPTFTGSAAETTALAAALLCAGLRALAGRVGAGHDQHDLLAAAVRLDNTAAAPAWLSWPNDLTIAQGGPLLEVRIAAPAMREMRAEAVRGRRLHGSAVETGGYLLGAVDEACGCIWIDTASGPPQDSVLSPAHLKLGTDGISDLLAYHRRNSAGQSTFIGTWHTHPNHDPRRSPTDLQAMAELLAGRDELAVPRAVMVILGGDPARWSQWLDSGAAPQIDASYHHASTVARPKPTTAATASDQDAWTGGWRRRPLTAAKPGLGRTDTR